MMCDVEDQTTLTGLVSSCVLVLSFAERLSYKHRICVSGALWVNSDIPGSQEPDGIFDISRIPKCTTYFLLSFCFLCFF